MVKYHHRQSAAERQRRKIKHHGRVVERGLARLRKITTWEQRNAMSKQQRAHFALKLGRPTFMPIPSRK